MIEKPAGKYLVFRKLFFTVVLSLIILATLEALATVGVLNLASPVLASGKNWEAQPDSLLPESYNRDDHSTVLVRAGNILPAASRSGFTRKTLAH